MKKDPIILIADDIEIMREMIKRILVKNGLNKIIQADDGDKALRLFKLRRPELVFLDINMPMKNGIECMKEILIHKADTFVVIVSANSTPENVKKAIKAGAKGFIVKPLNGPNKVEAMLKAFAKQFI